ncbi:uncharacterized protein LOC141614345 [Silene latifolia]|uniref:uncharacterized protein LOC141614345 n=1 Tax=Silene latifolia TaxID=37657 RepID=UPI003D785C8D
MCRHKSRGGIGFRDFENFNLALLGKQAWRLVMNTDCLMARVMKGKYFYGKSFMDAELGSNPSFTWRGILEARMVVRLGARKRIGNGFDTKASEEMRVSELIDATSNTWDTAKVHSHFLPFECDRILRIRLSESKPADTWCWEAEKYGNYTVKSVHRLLMEEIEGGNAGRSDYGEGKWLWSKIWRTPVLPRVKVFFWQLCNDAIATKKNIAARLHLTDDTCPRCLSNVETCLHVVRDCGCVEGIWEGLSVDVLPEAGFLRVREWVEEVFRGLCERECVTFMTGCWAIWEKRNKALFDQGEWREEEVIRRTHELIWEMERVQSEGIGTGLGIVCRNASGSIEWCVTIQSVAGLTPELAEALAVLEGLKEARCSGHAKVEVESDCRGVIADLKARKSGRSELALIYDDIFSLCNCFDVVSFSFVSRNFNTVAHGLAHAVLWTVGRQLREIVAEVTAAECSKTAELRSFNLSKEVSSSPEITVTNDTEWKTVGAKTGTPLEQPRVKIKTGDVQGELEFWSTSVFCFVLGANPPNHVMDGFVRRIWKDLSIDKVAFQANGICIVRLSKQEDKDSVLQSEQLLFDNKPFIIRD